MMGLLCGFNSFEDLLELCNGYVIDDGGGGVFLMDEFFVGIFDGV